MSDWKDKLKDMAYSAEPDFENISEESDIEPIGLPKHKQSLCVETDKKGRKGKTATIITGFEGSAEELMALEKLLKIKCGVGGSSRGGEILIQGDVKHKVLDILHKEGYAKAKSIN